MFKALFSQPLPLVSCVSLSQVWSSQASWSTTAPWSCNNTTAISCYLLPGGAMPIMLIRFQTATVVQSLCSFLCLFVTFIVLGGKLEGNNEKIKNHLPIMIMLCQLGQVALTLPILPYKPTMSSQNTIIRCICPSQL